MTTENTISTLQLNPSTKDDNENNEIKVYTKRWVVLLTFCSVSFLNEVNWIEHSVIQDVTIAFYNESLPKNETDQQTAVNWLTMIYMLVYIPFVFPAMFFLDRKGLKLTVLLGALFNAIGSVIKCFAVRPDLFLVLMLGQFFCAVSQAFLLSVPARIAALWFGANQVALATSIGVFGNQLGIGFGFLTPPFLVFIDNIDSMKMGFYYLYIGMAILSTATLTLTIIFVKDKPEIPPSISQLEMLKNTQAKLENETNLSDFRNFKNSFLNLIKNGNFILILMSYGINVGVFYSLSTLLNTTISEFYKNENQKIGYFGLILIVSGLFGSILGGVVLDKFKKFKLVTIIFCICSLASMILFSITLTVDINIIFGTIFLLGFFLTGYLPVGFDLAAEVTYPEPEGLSTGLLNTSAQIFGLLFTYAQGIVITTFNSHYGNSLLCIGLLVGSVLTVLVKSDLRRQNAKL